MKIDQASAQHNHWGRLPQPLHDPPTSVWMRKFDKGGHIYTSTLARAADVRNFVVRFTKLMTSAELCTPCIDACCPIVIRAKARFWEFARGPQRHKTFHHAKKVLQMRLHGHDS